MHCGESHTALVTSSGALLTFGDGRDGKLGLGEENLSNKFRPAPVSRFTGFTVQEVRKIYEN